MQTSRDLLVPANPVHTRSMLEASIAAGHGDAETHYRLWEICQLCGDPALARTHLDRAISIDPLRAQIPTETPVARTILALAVPGDFQANLPLRFALDDTTAIHTFWIAAADAVAADPSSFVPPNLPAIDAVFIVIAEAPRHCDVLRAADLLAARLGVPVINRGAIIARQSRIAVSARLGDLAGAVIPRHVRVDRATLAAAPPAMPFIVRPEGSHAGQSLSRVDDRAMCDAYLVRERAACFVVAPFVDFSGHDGLFRKFRVVYVEGRPYPVHLAVHDDWAVWYYNADMAAHPARQIEETRFLHDMERVLGPCATRALYDIGARIGLDYFGLDAALMPDGKLLVFEVETGMIVHDPGASDVPRSQAAARIRRAIERMIDGRVARRDAA